MRGLKSGAWLFAVCTSLLIACGVEAPPTEAVDPNTETVQHALSAPAGAEVVIPHVLHTPGTACTPPAFALCCPFAQGCSCQGTQSCENGTWSSCDGAGQRGQPCP